jgi:hypothetical protein
MMTAFQISACQSMAQKASPPHTARQSCFPMSTKYT